MREIKFKVWDKVLNKMITQENVIELLDKINSEQWETGYPYSSDEWYPAYQILGIFDYFNDIQKQGIKRYEPSENRFEIMQYTGLKDKNGKEIYEGDIVELKANSGCCEMTGIIIYDELDLAFELKDIEEGNQECLWYQEQELEVIGNIYDNPELSETEDK